ncbi:MAG: NAD-dependent deacylase, partial [Comamonadaceae bacterium]
MLTPDPLQPPLELTSHLKRARHAVVLTGAGMSAESGIPTFRDQGTGLWANFDPAKLATEQAFRKDPGTVWAWYETRRRQVARAQPNPGHVGLAKLAGLPWLQDFCIVTQNVDDLHERAGSASVLHLHGSLFAPRCLACARPFEEDLDALHGALEEEPASLPPPRCTHCGGQVRPGVVWFGESLPEAPWMQAMARIGKADLLLVIGTSGQVYPAASLPAAARRHGCKVVVINPDGDVGGEECDLHWQVPAAQG